MLTRVLYFNFLIILSITFCNTSFNTVIGKCHLNYELSKKDDEIVQYIKKTTNDLINEFGLIKKQNFYVDIINNSKNLPKELHQLDWAIGIAKKNRAAINGIKIDNYKKLLQTITHEICHIYQYRIKNSNTFPSWFKEGMAMYFSKEFSTNRKNLVSQAIWLNCLIELKELENIAALDKNQISLGYQESLIAYETIINQYGIQSIKAIIEKMNNKNLSFDNAFEKTNNISLIEFQKQFDNSIKSTKNRWGILNNPMNWFFLSTILLIIVYVFTKCRNRKVREKMTLDEELEKLDENLFNDNNS